MLDSLVWLVSKFLIEGMLIILVGALIFRYLAYRASRQDHVYFSTFTREVERHIQEDSREDKEVDDVDSYLKQMLESVASQLPSRGIRLPAKLKRKKKKETSTRYTSLRDYTGGSQSLIHGIQSESNVFKSPHLPDFGDLAKRVMRQDEYWTKLFRAIPIDSASRLIDMLPGMFIVFGIFGTFIGISNALPQIASIDFDQISGSSEVLGTFVLDVTFAMKTSITGLMCSIVLNFLNTLSPIGAVRSTISEKFENCLEQLWYFTRGGEYAERNQHHFYERMIESLRAIEGKLELTGRKSSSSGDESTAPKRRAKPKSKSKRRKAA